MKFRKIFLSSLTLAFATTLAFGGVAKQGKEQTEETKYKRAWEVGIGGSVFQFSRIDFTNFTKAEDYYRFNLQIRHNVIGPNLYIARELSPHIYLDLQGTAGLTKQYIGNNEKLRTLYMVGPGLQWRLGEYFESKYIDPFFRVGASFMQKNFDMRYRGIEGTLPEEMSWIFENIYNKHGKDRDQLIPISLGFGVNGWLNDRFGIGLQGDYLYMPYKDVANSLQGTVRLIWRMGGRSKKAAPAVEYVQVDRVVEAPPITVEKIVEVEVPAKAQLSYEQNLCELFNSIYFAFDKSDIRPQSEPVLDKIAEILKLDTARKYLIIGHTDIRGSESYNIALSRRRAAAVLHALEQRGVPMDMLKSRGVGKKISYAEYKASHEIREGDRKVTVEIITNMDYWNYIPKRDY